MHLAFNPFLLAFFEQAAKEKAERLARGEPEPEPEQEPVPIEIVYGEDDDDDGGGGEEHADSTPAMDTQTKKSAEEANLEEMWLAVDVQQSGTLSRTDVASVLSRMGVRADDDTLDLAMTGEMQFSVTCVEAAVPPMRDVARCPCAMFLPFFPRV